MIAFIFAVGDILLSLVVMVFASIGAVTVILAIVEAMKKGANIGRKEER